MSERSYAYVILSLAFGWSENINNAERIQKTMSPNSAQELSSRCMLMEIPPPLTCPICYAVFVITDYIPDQATLYMLCSVFLFLQWLSR